MESIKQTRKQLSAQCRELTNMQSITYLFILRGITNNKHRISTKKTVSIPYFKQLYGVVMVIDGEIPSIALPVSWFFPAARFLWLLSGLAERLGSCWCSSCSTSEQGLLPLKHLVCAERSRMTSCSMLELLGTAVAEILNKHRRDRWLREGPARGLTRLLPSLLHQAAAAHGVFWIPWA